MCDDNVTSNKGYQYTEITKKNQRYVVELKSTVTKRGAQQQL